MYARVEMAATRTSGQVVAVPDSAVLDTGARQLVLVQREEGRFEPRTVKTGTRADGYIEVLEGVKAGENVVVSANFLIDAESNLKAAIAGMGGMAMGAAKPAASKDGKPAAPPPTPIKDGKPMADMPMPSAGEDKPPAAKDKGR
jgi:Cu(I)/Ag(I) efflux system membrane fusion protein